MNGLEYRFLDCCLMPEEARFFRGTREAYLPPKIFGFLSVLAQSDGHLVTRAALIAQLWDDRPTSDEAVARVVAQSRKAVGDSAAQQRIIQTVPKRGFRMVADVKKFYLDAPAGGFSQLMNRYQKASDTTQCLLQSAALFGEEFELQLVTGLMRRSVTELTGTVAQALELNIIQPTGKDRFRFTCRLLQAFIYESLASDQRRQGHRRIADLLGQRLASKPSWPGDRLNQVLHHAIKSGDFDVIS